MKRPHILLTNDDGIHAPGLKHLWQALVEHADISIVAPASEKSGTSLAITLRTPLHVEQVSWEKGTIAWKMTGTPADCVRMGISTLLTKKPDIILSGINRGSNAGRAMLYSGTVGGVIEATMRKFQAIAFSSDEFFNTDYAALEKHIFPMVSYLLENPMPSGTFLNVNFPAGAEFKGFKMARQGMSYWIEKPEKRHHPEGSIYYWLGGKWDDHPEPEESDVVLMKQGYVVVAPIHINELTDHAVFNERKASFESLFG